MRAFETTAVVADDQRLILDEHLSCPPNSRVRVVVLMPEEEDISREEWLRFAARDGAFDFLRDPAEDVYSVSDGEAYRG